MPSAESGGLGNFWYSFDHGMVHYIQIDTGGSGSWFGWTLMNRAAAKMKIVVLLGATEMPSWFGDRMTWHPLTGRRRHGLFNNKQAGILSG
ncbi:hypothetical protein JOM56_011528 [Amanita muscaria]